MTLIDLLSDEKFLIDQAWAGLNKSYVDSYGYSGEALGDFKTNLDTRVSSISKSLKKGTYTFGFSRASVIPKNNGKYRPLQIPDVQDRLVLKGIAIIIENVLQNEFKNIKAVSFAFHKGKGVEDAIEKMRYYYANDYKVIFGADIINFFPTVDRDLLLKQLFEKLPDPTLNKLISSGIGIKVKGLDKIKSEHHSLFGNADIGIPQGNPLSPLFSNLFLKPFDEKMIDEHFALIRYADDFIVMCKNVEEAKRAHDISKSKLLDLGLKIYDLHEEDSKTRIVNPEKELFSFLSITFDGKKIYPSRKGVNRFITNLETLCFADNKTKDVLELLRRVNHSIDGWVSTYSYTDLERYFSEIDAEIDKKLYKSLSRFGWDLKDKGKVKGKHRKKTVDGRLDSGDCLSPKQRAKSGVPLCIEILNQRRKSKKNRLSAVLK